MTDNYFYVRPSRFFSDKFSTIVPIIPVFDIFQGKPNIEYHFAGRHSHLYLPKYWGMIDSYAYVNAKKLSKPEFEDW